MSKLFSYKNPAPALVDYLTAAFQTHETAELPESLAVFGYLPLEDVTPRLLITFTDSLSIGTDADHTVNLEFRLHPPQRVRKDDNDFEDFSGIGNQMDSIFGYAVFFMQAATVPPGLKVSGRTQSLLQPEVTEAGDMVLVQGLTVIASLT